MIILKLILSAFIVIALYLLWRFLFSKKTVYKNDSEKEDEKQKKLPNIMGKSSFVMPDLRQPLPTPAKNQKNKKAEENESTFANATEEKKSVAIPTDELDETFEDEKNPVVMTIPLEEEVNDIDLEEEAEEIRQAVGQDINYAEGIGFEDLHKAVDVVNEMPENVNQDVVNTFKSVEETDMFEVLASGERSKVDWIKSVLKRSEERIAVNANNSISEIDYGDFDVADVL